MVDPVGATLGVLGLAGLFTVAVDCFDYIKAGRTVGKSFAICETQLTALRMRLFAWGYAVRLTDRAGYDQRFNDPRWKRHVQQQLNVISLLFVDIKKIVKKYDLEERYDYRAQGPTGVNAVFLEENFKDFLQRAKKTQEKAGIFRAMRYSLSSQKEFKELLENLEKAVGQLEWVLKNLDLFKERNIFISALPTTEDDSASTISDLTIQDRTLDQPIVEDLEPIEDAPAWMVPVGRNSKFAGREDDLEKLDGILFSKRNDFTKAAVYGLGGIGKTQVVLELAYRTRDRIPDCSIIWVPALTAEIFRRAYQEIGRQLKIPGIDSPDCDVEERVKDYLSSEYQGRWLLIVDNADDTELWSKRAARANGDVSKSLINSLPRSSKGSIVLTTRNRTIAADFSGVPGATIEVLKMNEGIAIQLFQKSVLNESVAQDVENIRLLLEELAYLPLAISQATSYINQTGTPVPNYLEILRGQEADKIELLSKDFEDEGRYDADLDPSCTRNAIATTWLISFEQIQKQSHNATNYLAFMAFMEPKDIPLSMLPIAESQTKFHDMIGILESYGLVTRRTDSQSLDIHRLVHLATRNWLRGRNEFQFHWETALAWLAEVLARVDDYDLTLLKSYIPHASRLLQEKLKFGDDEATLTVMATKTVLIMKAAVYFRLELRLKQSYQKHVEVVQQSKLTFGEHHRDVVKLEKGTIECLREISGHLRRQGRYAEAEESLKMALQLSGIDDINSCNATAIPA
jgi:hypothetical protein